MFGISFEHILVLGIILLVVGPRRLPELGNTLGKAIKNFKDAISGVEEAKFRKLPDTPDHPVSGPTAGPTKTVDSTPPHPDTPVASEKTEPK